MGKENNYFKILPDREFNEAVRIVIKHLEAMTDVLKKDPSKAKSGQFVMASLSTALLAIFFSRFNKACKEAIVELKSKATENMDGKSMMN